jgi:peptidoglycan/LPS O-acetylase OafA/YrhL
VYPLKNIVGTPTTRPDIDGLRATAIALVAVYHIKPTWLPGGFIGVDVFFVISGFLISRIIIGSLERGTFSLAGFYARRIRRILPALIVMLAARVWGFGWEWKYTFPEDFSELGRQILAGAAFASNLLTLLRCRLFRRAGLGQTAAAPMVPGRRRTVLHSHAPDAQ